MDDRVREIEENGTVGQWPGPDYRGLNLENADEDEHRQILIRDQSFMVKSRSGLLRPGALSVDTSLI